LLILGSLALSRGWLDQLIGDLVFQPIEQTLKTCEFVVERTGGIFVLGAGGIGKSLGLAKWSVIEVRARFMPR